MFFYFNLCNVDKLCSIKARDIKKSLDWKAACFYLLVSANCHLELPLSVSFHDDAIVAFKGDFNDLPVKSMANIFPGLWTGHPGTVAKGARTRFGPDWTFPMRLFVYLASNPSPTWLSQLVRPAWNNLHIGISLLFLSPTSSNFQLLLTG
jgi:hypothetical protein